MSAFWNAFLKFWEWCSISTSCVLYLDIRKKGVLFMCIFNNNDSEVQAYAAQGGGGCLHPCRHSKLGWMGLWARDGHRGYLCSLWGGETRWPLEVLYCSSDSVIVSSWSPNPVCGAWSSVLLCVHSTVCVLSAVGRGRSPAGVLKSCRWWKGHQKPLVSFHLFFTKWCFCSGSLKKESWKAVGGKTHRELRVRVSD